MFTAREFKNGMLIFIGIALYFLLMELLGLSNNFYLRILNVFIVLYGMNKTIYTNIHDGRDDYLFNFASGIKTGAVGVIASILALNVYIHVRGGEAYIKTLSEAFLFGGNPTIYQYTAGLLFEALASTVVGSYILIQYWNGKTYSDKHVTH